MSLSYRPFATELEQPRTDSSALIARLVRHEEQLRFDDFSLDDAWRLGQLIRATAEHDQLPVVITIVLGEQRAFHTALPGAAANNDRWADRKIAVVRLFNAASYRVGVEAAARGSDINDRLPAEQFAAHGGAFPLLSRSGTLFGVVAVSGLPSEHDHALVVSALAELAGVALD